MASSNKAPIFLDRDDPFSLAIERERHSLLCEPCEASELFIDIERLIRLVPKQGQQAIALADRADQNDASPSRSGIVDSMYRGR